MVPSCNQTWQWKPPLNARFNGKRSVNEGCSKIMHPQGKPLQLAEKNIGKFTRQVCWGDVTVAGQLTK